MEVLVKTLGFSVTRNFLSADPVAATDWMDDDEWEQNWERETKGTTAAPKATALKASAATKTASQPAVTRTNDDFESYNPLSSVKSTPKAKSNEDDLWDLLNQ